MASHNYDPNVIIQAAQEKLANNDFEGGQMIFQSALLDWVDDAREESSSAPAETVQQAVATLWLAYAHFLAHNKQFKSAMEAYEQAVQCPVAGCVGRVWLDYARFAEERGKLKTAQDIYLRALVVASQDTTTAAVTDEQDQTLLWQEFLVMMQKSNPELTLTELQSAVQQEHVVATTTTTADLDQPEPVSSTNLSRPMEPPAKRLKTDTIAADRTTTMPIRNHVVTAESVQVEAQAFGEALMLQSSLHPDLAAAWMIRDGNGPAQPPEPPLFQPSPPKLSDPTAKDILGTDLALALIERVSDPASGTLLLEVCKGLWALQALKEKKATEAIQMLDQTMKTELEKLETTLEARLSVAAPTAIRVSVAQMNDNARREFQTTCGQQRQNLLTGIAWEFRQLLCVQQQILTKLQVPGFVEGPTVDAGGLELQARVCLYLHSAFFLRSRVGEEPHVNMLKGHLKTLQKEQQSRTTSPVPPSFSAQSRTTSPVPLSFPAHQTGHLPPTAGTYSGYPPPQQQPPAVMGLPPLPPPQDYGAPPRPQDYGTYPMPMGNQPVLPPPPPAGPYGNQQYTPQKPPYYQ